MIALIDYGAGNMGSVLKAVQYLGYPARAVNRPELLSSAEKIIFPGQGHFGAMMNALAERRMFEPLSRALEAGKPFLGISLGFRDLYYGSNDGPSAPGLGHVPDWIGPFEGVF